MVCFNPTLIQDNVFRLGCNHIPQESASDIQASPTMRISCLLQCHELSMDKEHRCCLHQGSNILLRQILAVFMVSEVNSKILI